MYLVGINVILFICTKFNGEYLFVQSYLLGDSPPNYVLEQYSSEKYCISNKTAANSTYCETRMFIFAAFCSMIVRPDGLAVYEYR